MHTGLTWSVRVPSGAQLTILPPGTSEGAETNPDCYRVARYAGHARRFRMDYATGAHIAWIKPGPTLGVKRGVFRGKTI